MIIGICGPKYCGKSTLAHYLVTNYKFTNLSFAEPIKMMLTTLVVYQGATSEHARRMFYGDLKNEPSEYLDGRTPVQAMQTLGTEWGREIISEFLWVNVLRRHISKRDYSQPPQHYKIRARFNPKRRDDMKPHLSPLVGEVFEWTFAGTGMYNEPYPGQWRWMPPSDDKRWKDAAWAPDEDLEVIEERNVKIVIDDLRFVRSEDDFIHANNGKIIRLSRHGAAPSEHRSEREYLQIKADIDIENNGTIEETFLKIPAEWIYGKI